MNGIIPTLADEGSEAQKASELAQGHIVLRSYAGCKARSLASEQCVEPCILTLTSCLLSATFGAAVNMEILYTPDFHFFLFSAAFVPPGKQNR